MPLTLLQPVGGRLFGGLEPNLSEVNYLDSGSSVFGNHVALSSALSYCEINNLF